MARKYQLGQVDYILVSMQGGSKISSQSWLPTTWRFQSSCLVPDATPRKTNVSSSGGGGGF